ncbi:hypothetical protein EZV62_016187 [Acer yangbiense]|uniref:Cytochrome P450 n=1 Tax=Acer yangbiense TaxID=1000413 RepID=A0A5C7HNK0_9ROSI|nr:hypothetical protein EZV62_016187 [Acer yangbiense]
MMSLLVWSSLFLLAALILLSSRKKSGNGNQPPGPPGWPIIGNILDLGTVPHQDFYKLRSKYGPVLWLKSGSINTVVIQSAKAATEFFKNHNHIFCDRKSPTVLTAHNYYQGSLAIGRYGVYWRIIQHLCSMELPNIEDDVSATQARGELDEVDLSRYLFFMVFNLVGKLKLSRDLLDSQSKEGQEFFAAMKKVVEWTGKPNLADFLPFLKRLDPQGIKRNMVRDMGCSLKIVSGFVKERIEEQCSRENKQGLLNSMQETNFMGYLIPKDTQVFVNAWAIGRDPECWEDPMSFKPERFLGSNIEIKGQNFPFGSGRRICVGILLAERVLHLGVASLLHYFEWELGKDVTPESMDMNERIGITV